jgi:F-type H+-transporting ATPase subunit gamma
MIMSETLPSLHRKITKAKDLRSVVSTMKAMAAANIGQYAKAARALDDYYRAVQLGLSVCLRPASGEERASPVIERKARRGAELTGAVVFGSDQALVGRFNEVIAEYAIQALSAQPARKKIWVVGERAQDYFSAVGLSPAGIFTLPASVNSITSLVGEILVEILSAEESETEPHRKGKGRGGSFHELYLFYNSSRSGLLHEPVSQRLLPLDETWQLSMTQIPWPTKNLPQVLGSITAAAQALVREYLFVSIFRACAESLASENTSRLAAMERAERNIDQLRDELQRTFYRLRQDKIDEELFDVIAGGEAVTEAQQSSGRTD